MTYAALRRRLLGAAGALTILAVLVPATASASTGRLTALPGSSFHTRNAATGQFRSARMTVEVVLAPQHTAQLHRLLTGLYDAHSSSYRRWLKPGQFTRRFAPSASETRAIRRYLTARGLRPLRSDSVFLVRAAGSSRRVESAFHTTMLTYRGARETDYFANASAVRLPAALSGGVLSVVGLNNTVRPRTAAIRTPATTISLGQGRANGKSSCETPYPTPQQLATAVSTGVNFPYGYGAGPGCSGLTPSQDNSLYGAPSGGTRVKGAGATVAVFELSAYKRSDINTWAQQFYGSGYPAPVQNVTTDGGPLDPVCPTGDTCPPSFNGYSGDIEVDADIEMQLAIAPDVKHLIVYEAPNDETGQTELDQYTAIAKADKADSISSSWAVCENDVTAGYVRAENLVFEQMAAQGQSMFSSAGDTGAFSCLRSDGTDIINVLDPGAQPWVTSVGGTSFPTFNPGTHPSPAYPAGQETVWNVDGLCNESANEYGYSGYSWCAAEGAGGGGFSQYWGRPSYQQGPGVNNPQTVDGNGGTQCALAATGTPCREVPDVSVDADEYTGYSEYCTGGASTPYSVCASIDTTPHGWFLIGGTSLSSPFMSAIVADRDGYIGGRSGNANEFLYSLFDRGGYGYFHDISGYQQVPNNNGYFKTRPYYDMATGIGTPIMAPIITGR